MVNGRKGIFPPAFHYFKLVAKERFFSSPVMRTGFPVEFYEFQLVTRLLVVLLFFAQLLCSPAVICDCRACEYATVKFEQTDSSMGEEAMKAYGATKTCNTRFDSCYMLPIEIPGGGSTVWNRRQPRTLQFRLVLYSTGSRAGSRRIITLEAGAAILPPLFFDVLHRDTYNCFFPSSAVVGEFKSSNQRQLYD